MQLGLSITPLRTKFGVDNHGSSCKLLFLSIVLPTEALVCYPHPSHSWKPNGSPGPDSSDRRQHAAATRVPDAQDGPVSCKIKLLFLEAICVLRKRINKLTPWPLKKNALRQRIYLTISDQRGKMSSIIEMVMEWVRRGGVRATSEVVSSISWQLKTEAIQKDKKKGRFSGWKMGSLGPGSELLHLTSL